MVDLHADGLYRFLLSKSRDEDVAKDLVQETFSKVWLKKDDVAFEKGKTYLFTTGFNTFIDHTRKNSRFESYTQEKHFDDGYRQTSSDLKDVLEQALDKLPEIQKTVVLLRDYEGYDYAEIGEITNLTESQVKVYIFRARKALKNYLVSVDLVI